MSLFRVVALATVLAVVGLPADAKDKDRELTGRWKGLQVCDDVDGGVAQNFVTDDWVEISQRGDHIRLRRVTRDNELILIYEGVVMALEESRRFEAMLTVCDGSYEAEEMLRLRRVRVDRDGGGSFDAESLYMSEDVPSLRGIRIFGTCKWAYERVSERDPDVPSC